MNGSFEQFHQRANAGERLNVVFMGGSLTWGANATDPQQTSYRARVGQWLLERYPKSQIICHDASIGGSGSRLGIFRLDRDVLAKKPDLLFLDFTANDNLRHSDAESLASYEAIVRRTISEAGCPVVLVILPFKGDVTADPALFKRAVAHRAIAKAYGCAVGDAVELMQSLHRAGQASLDQWWDNPRDSTHPGDVGYTCYARAATDAFDDAVRNRQISRVPVAMLYADTFMHTSRCRLQRQPLPEGWSATAPTRIAAYFDMQPSRWLDELTVASAAAKPLELKFRGTFVALWGEALPEGGSYRVVLDGKPLKDPFNTAVLSGKAGGAVRYFQPLASGLDGSVQHVIRIEPVLAPDQSLRFESLLLAGDRCGVE